MKIINLTHHKASPEQLASGVVDHPDHATLCDLLTFTTLPTQAEVKARARRLTALTHGYNQAMIGGAPYLMSQLEYNLLIAGVQPLYAFSLRECVEEAQPDGSVRKTMIFRHSGFVEAPQRVR